MTRVQLAAYPNLLRYCFCFLLLPVFHLDRAYLRLLSDISLALVVMPFLAGDFVNLIQKKVEA